MPKATEGASATATAVAAAATGATRAGIVEKETIAVVEQANALQITTGNAITKEELQERAEEAGRALEEHKRRQAGRAVRWYAFIMYGTKAVNWAADEVLRVC